MQLKIRLPLAKFAAPALEEDDIEDDDYEAPMAYTDGDFDADEDFEDDLAHQDDPLDEDFVLGRGF